MLQVYSLARTFRVLPSELLDLSVDDVSFCARIAEVGAEEERRLMKEAVDDAKRNR